MQELIFILFLIGFIALIIWVIKSLINSSANTPTWNGIIISALVGMLPLYLFLCFFGVMGEKRDNDIQPTTGSYAENMSRRYASSKKQRNWLKYTVVALVVIFIILILQDDESKESVVAEPVNTNIIDSISAPNEDILVETEKNYTTKHSTTPKQVADKNTESKYSNAISSTIENNYEITDENINSTIELLEKENHARVIEQAKREGVSTEGSTIEILERINHASVVKQAKREGVSTEGSTIEILERINRKYLEK